MNWNLQEKGKTKAEVLAALAAHPSCKARKANVEGVTVDIPPQMPEEVQGAIGAMIDALPEVPEGQVLNVTTWGSEGIVNLNLALEQQSA